MSDDTAANGQRVSYTVKELIANQTRLIEDVDKKLVGVVSKLDQKADSTVVAELRARIDVLDSNTIKREGPLVSDIRANERAIDKLQIDLANIKAEHDSSNQTTRWWVTGPLFFVINLTLASTILVLNHPWTH